MAFCRMCGREIPNDSNLCPFCGTPTGANNPVPPNIPPSAQVNAYAMPAPKGNAVAIASMVLGICAMVLFLVPILPIVLGVVGLILGIVGVVGKYKKHKGMAIAGIITSVVGAVINVLILVGVIALFVSPNIERSRESKDLQQLDNILSSANTAMANYRIEGKGVIDFGSASTGIQDVFDTDGSEQDLIQHAVVEELSEGTGKASSRAAGGSDVHIYLSYDMSIGFLSVGYSLSAPEIGERVDGIPCDYTDNTVFEVSTQWDTDGASESESGTYEDSDYYEDGDYDDDYDDYDDY